MNDNNSFDRLCICRTKLQAYTFCLLLSKEKKSFDFILFIDDCHNRDNLQFLERLSEANNIKFSYYAKKNVFSDVNSIINFAIKNRCHDLYISSLGNGYISLMLGILRYDCLLTFDDGAANLEKQSFVYVPRNSIARKFFFTIFYKSKDLETIIDSSSVHFNIFPKFLYPYPGYFRNEVNINFLFNNINIDLNIGSYDCIFIAPCYEEYFNDPLEGYQKTTLFLKNKIREGSRVLYVNHPRSSFEVPKELATEKKLNGYLLEELVPSFFKENEVLELVGFGNTTQAFFLNDKRVKITILINDGVKEKYVNHFFFLYSQINKVVLD